MNDPVTIFEVGPRDGLQNEKALIATGAKVRLIDCLSNAGFTKIEAASFVSPKWVPQMADGHDVMARITRKDTVTYAVLTPNMKGYERAIAAKADEVAIFGSASQGFSQKNINCSIEESLARFRPLADQAKADGMAVRGYISCVIDCPYDGKVAPKAVADIAQKLFAMGCYEISLGDTTGAGTPQSVNDMLDAVLDNVPAARLAGHFHDTGNQALFNIEACLERGLRTFDSAIGGLGGCPYAPGAKGNVATTLVHNRLSELGFDTGLNPDGLEAANACLTEIMAGLSHG